MGQDCREQTVLSVIQYFVTLTMGLSVLIYLKTTNIPFLSVNVLCLIPCHYQQGLCVGELLCSRMWSSGILWRCFGCFTHTVDLPAVVLSKQAVLITGSRCISLSALCLLLLWPHAMPCLRRSLWLKIQPCWGSHKLSPESRAVLVCSHFLFPLTRSLVFLITVY